MSQWTAVCGLGRNTLPNALIWVDAHRAARTVIDRHPDRVLTIRYEDFLASQEETLRKVCGFLEIEYLPEMLDVARSPEAHQISQLSALWASNCFRPIAANVDKFKKQISHEEIEIIETLAKDEMQRYGCQLITDASATFADDALDAALQRSDVAKQAAWVALEHANFRDYVLRSHRAQHLAVVRERLEARAGAPLHKTDAPYKLSELKGTAVEVTDRRWRACGSWVPSSSGAAVEMYPSAEPMLTWDYCSGRSLALWGRWMLWHHG